ncbi:diguanylate cyclase [Pararobbsia alpina]|uniref:putative bifunctional diguanylate cyclase/phosphodiesterase n=1 Tax=Pararobbsia alpina TaxID=621374 RepID=UPI0039A64670
MNIPYFNRESRASSRRKSWVPKGNATSATSLTLRANLVSVAAALFMMATGLLLYQAMTLRATLTDNATLQASIIAENVSAAVMFADERGTDDVLRPLARVPYVESVSVYLPDGALFARYSRPGLSQSEREEGTLRSVLGHKRLSLNDVFVGATIRHDGKELGHIVLVATTGQMSGELVRYACFITLACLCAIWTSTVIMSRLRRRVMRAERELEYLAWTDPLTELCNRRAFHDTLHRLLQTAKDFNRRVGLVLVDLDDFKSINDTLGHATGDALLQQVAELLTRATRHRGTVSRLGGDEFAVTVDGDPDAAVIQDLADEISEALNTPIECGGRIVFPAASIGFSTYPEGGKDAVELVSSADVALYEAKARGKNCVVGFSNDMTDAVKRRATLEFDLRNAINNNALDLVYQPQFDCHTGVLVGAEALSRWTHSAQGPISPSEFIPIAEGSDLIVVLGRWVLNQACKAAAMLNANGARELRVAVNISARQLRHPHFLSDVRHALEVAQLRPGLLEIELTESHLISNVTAAMEIMTALRALGVSLSLDDFGTGYSSLSYLHDFPIDTLKIDRTFIKGLPDEGESIVTAILSMAHSFGIDVVAEGVEDKAQLEWLAHAGCDTVQGFLTGRPMPLESLRALVCGEGAQMGGVTHGPQRMGPRLVHPRSRPHPHSPSPT